MRVDQKFDYVFSIVWVGFFIFGMWVGRVIPKLSEEDEHPCMVVWHMRTSALSMMERLATAL